MNSAAAAITLLIAQYQNKEILATEAMARLIALSKTDGFLEANDSIGSLSAARERLADLLAKNKAGVLDNDQLQAQSRALQLLIASYERAPHDSAASTGPNDEELNRDVNDALCKVEERITTALRQNAFLKREWKLLTSKGANETWQERDEERLKDRIARSAPITIKVVG